MFEQVPDERIGKLAVRAQYSDHWGAADSYRLHVCQSGCGVKAGRGVGGETALADEMTSIKKTR